MTSFIIVSSDIQSRDSFLENFLSQHHIDHFDQTFLKTETSVKSAQSIGIEDIKHMQKKLFLKPIKSQNKAVIIKDAHQLTHEAQNALLKVLEEPPSHTLIILVTNSEETLLPTILSRCQLIRLETKQPTLSEKEKTEHQTFIENLPMLSLGERLKKAELLAKDKEKAIEWVEKIILILRENVITAYTEHQETSQKEKYLRMITSFQTLYTQLKTTNVNIRMAFENTFLLDRL